MRLLKIIISKLLAKGGYGNYPGAILASQKGHKEVVVAHAGFEPAISSLRGRCPKPLDECATLKSSQKFTKKLLKKFLESRPQGISHRTVEAYHYTLSGFVGFPLTGDGITRYLGSLSCHNGKLKFYSCLRALFN